MKMKKKLLFFITCFFLFFSLTAFFVYRHLRSPEVPKKENNEEVKKEKTDKKTDSKDNLNKEEENDDLPWQFTWKGAIFSFILSCVIASRMIFMVSIFWEAKALQAPHSKKIFIFFKSLIRTLLYLVVFPLFFATEKYKDKSYGELFWLANSSSLVKIFLNITVLVLLLLLLFR